MTQRPYPFACRSMSCGEVQCPATCPELPALREFRAWVKASGATPDAWTGTIYTARA